MPFFISPIVGAVVKKGIVSVVGAVAAKEATKYFEKDHGSKVKEYAFKGCSIEMIDDKACIIVDLSCGEIVFLTSDEIESLEFVKEKFRVQRGHTYYYYNIRFKDGRMSYVRMRRKYRDAMLRHT